MIGPVLTAGPVGWLAQMLSHPFMQHALLAGTAIAALSGLVGYFVVLRGQVFAGDTLSHVAYAGALAALAGGVDLRFGLFAATIVVGLGLGLLGGTAAADDVILGTTLSWVLGLGVVFLAYYTTHGSTGNGAANVNVLFGSIFGISAHDAMIAAGLAAGLIVSVLVIARPLLFASIDSAVAAARGVPVKILGPVFLAIVGATAAEASQVVGALLLVGLIAAPAAAAQRLTDRPWTGLALSAAIGVTAMWGGLTLAYAVPELPASFAIMAFATGAYAAAAAASTLISRRNPRRRRRSAPDEPGRHPHVPGELSPPLPGPSDRRHTSRTPGRRARCR